MNRYEKSYQKQRRRHYIKQLKRSIKSGIAMTAAITVCGLLTLYFAHLAAESTDIISAIIWGLLSLCVVCVWTGISWLMLRRAGR